MNDKFLEMAKKCGYWSGETIEMNDVGIQEFANLILEECAARAEVYAYMSPNFNALAEEIRSMKS